MVSATTVLLNCNLLVTTTKAVIDIRLLRDAAKLRICPNYSLFMLRFNGTCSQMLLTVLVLIFLCR